jgi:hypothetical protein
MWATAIPNGAVEFEFSEGEASLSMRNVDVFDAFTVPNSVDQSRPFGAPPVSAKINSMTITWSGVIRTTTFTSTDPQERFAGSFKETDSHISVTVTTPTSTGHGFRFVSDEASTSSSNFAQIGMERNGHFF